MKRLGSLLIVSCLAIALSGAELAAQQRGCRAGQGPGMAMQGQMYDTNTVKSLKGKVMAIERVSMKMCPYEGVHLTLDSEGETISVHLGPAWYIDNQDQTLEVGDEVDVTGSAITYTGEPAIIAAEVRRGDEVLTLRNDQGVPAWQGWRQQAKPGSTSG